MPTIGENAASRLVVYHGGSMQGFTSSVYLLPETETAVFALQNSTALCDPCDWIPQLVVQTIFGHGGDLIDFEKFAKTAAATGAGLADAIEKQLQQEREPGTKPQKLTAYVGRYRNKANTFYIDIAVQEDGELYMCFQGLENETYRLRHYHRDIFVWNLSHNETARQGGFQTRPLCSYKIEFQSVDGHAGDVKINHLGWMYDESLLEPPVFLLEEVAFQNMGLQKLDRFNID
ncbi:putative D-aminoacylase [Ilyonectria robusta]